MSSFFTRMLLPDQMHVIIIHVVPTGALFLIVSGHWSDSPQNRFYALWRRHVASWFSWGMCRNKTREERVSLMGLKYSSCACCPLSSPSVSFVPILIATEASYFSNSLQQCFSSSGAYLHILYLCRVLGKGLGCVLIKSTLGSGKTQKGWMHGSNGEQRGQFTSNLELRRTIPVTAGGCQVSRDGDTKGKCYV
jgi:hypothetical protein